MPRLVWDSVGDRRFETGIDRGVLFSGDQVIPWNGLTSVKENATGGEVSPFYLDGIKYLEVPGREEYSGTIEAFTYPDAFAVHDGTKLLSSGLIVPQQRRRPFAFSYRSRIGNDVNGSDHGYKLHIVYNVLAQPSDHTYSSIGSSAEAQSFSWAISATPKRIHAEGSYAPIAHLAIDSTKTPVWLLRHIEDLLYGSVKTAPRLLSIDQIFAFFENPSYVLSIFPDTAHGLAQLVLETDGTGDLIGDEDRGFYEITSESRLTPTTKAGFYRLES